jgi:hypothetical protein
MTWRSVIKKVCLKFEQLHFSVLFCTIFHFFSTNVYIITPCWTEDVDDGGSSTVPSPA